MAKDKYLFLLDVDNIQGYIFDTNRLKTIIGASWVIDHVNASPHGDTFQLLKNYGLGTDEDKIKGNDNFIIYSSGGNTKIIFRDLKEAEEFEKKIIAAYSNCDISVTTHIQRFGSDVEDVIKDVLFPAEKIIAQKKFNKRYSLNIPASPYFKICELCGRRYAQRIISFADGKNAVSCGICKKKFDKGKEKPRLFPEYSFPTNIEKEMKPKNGMLATVVMDGNNMGDKIRALNDFSQLKKFSSEMESLIQKSFESCFEKYFKEEKDSKSFKSIRPLIVGGDDICFLVDGYRVFDFVSCLIEKINRASKENNGNIFGTEGITFSAGILIAKHNYPFNFAYRIAHSLLKSAKVYSREQGSCSSLDFHILLSSSGDEIQKIREKEYCYDDTNYLTRKPYSLEEFQNIKKDSKTLGDFLARNKRKAIREVLRIGRRESAVELLKPAMRMEKNDRAKYVKLLNKYMWNKSSTDNCWYTGLLDLSELSDFANS